LVWVSEVVLDLLAQDAAGGVDLLDGHLHTVLEHGAGAGTGAGECRRSWRLGQRQ
jgi:hypothetical protein